MPRDAATLAPFGTRGNHLLPVQGGHRFSDSWGLMFNPRRTPVRRPNPNPRYGPQIQPRHGAKSNPGTTPKSDASAAPIQPRYGWINPGTVGCLMRDDHVVGVTTDSVVLPLA